MFLLIAVLNILVRNASPRGSMCFRCLLTGICSSYVVYLCDFAYYVFG